jgi:hypothetical protein
MEVLPFGRTFPKPSHGLDHARPGCALRDRAAARLLAEHAFPNPGFMLTNRIIPENHFEFERLTCFVPLGFSQ